jgi:hypothetical protein
MHNCEEFRELITEHIIDREDVTGDQRFQHELLICSSCCEFYVESREMIDALSTVDVGEGFMPAFNLHQEILQTAVSVRRPKARAYVRALQFATAAALLLSVSVSLFRLPTPAPIAALPQSTYVEQSMPLDPVTVDFLQESELLLRNVMKLAPNDPEDLATAKKIASEQLIAIDQRKDAAAQLPPVVNVMDTYETVLRDIRNVDERNAADDIPDIQNRIQSNGLIATMKAFQPRNTMVNTVSYHPQ